MENNYPPFDESQLLRYLLNEAEETERRAIGHWLLEDEGNRRYLDSLEALWLEAGKLDPPPVAVDVDAAWARVDARITGTGTESRGRVVRMTPLRWAMSAAAVILLVIGAWFLTRLVVFPGKTIELVSQNAQVSDTLPDGSVVTMNINSKLSYPERFRENRNVKLTGEAFFNVTRDPRFPFTVETGKAGVRVLGTSFNVRAYPGQDVEVSVKSGKVRMFAVEEATGDTLSLILEAEEAGVIRQGSGRPELLDSGDPEGFYWLDETLWFRQTQLSAVFRILEKNYHVSIRANDPSVYSCRLTASFSDQPVAEILNVIAASFGWEVRFEQGDYVIYGTGCKE